MPVLLGLALRTIAMGGRPLWADEAFTWYWTRLPLGEWSWLWEIDFNPPLYYLWVKPFHLLEGLGLEASVAARVPPLVLEIGFLAWAWGAIRRSALPQGGLWLALWAVAPAAVEGAGVGRGYTMLVWLAAIAWTALERRLADPGDRLAGWWLTGSLALALYTHYYAFFLVLAMALRVARAGEWRRLVAWFAPPLLLFLPWLPKFVVQVSRGNEMIQPLALTRIPRGLAAMLSGQVVFLGSPGLGATEVVVLLATAALGGWLAWRGVRALRARGARLAWEALCLPAVALAVSMAGLQVWEEYWFLPGLAPLLWLVVAGVGSLAPSWRRAAAMGLFLGMLGASAFVPAYVHQEWDRAVRKVPMFRGGPASGWTFEGGEPAVPTGRETIYWVLPNIEFDTESIWEAMRQAGHPFSGAWRPKEARRVLAAIEEMDDARTCKLLGGDSGMEWWVVGSHDPVPAGGVRERLEQCPGVRLESVWVGQRVFVAWFRREVLPPPPASALFPSQGQ